ncbi:MAG: hypothetical protein LBG20_00130 [Holosporaceae bacterium]|nr:hypothetical protein [Holosporaceae bacterium]
MGKSLRGVVGLCVVLFVHLCASCATSYQQHDPFHDSNGEIWDADCRDSGLPFGVKLLIQHLILKNILGGHVTVPDPIYNLPSNKYDRVAKTMGGVYISADNFEDPVTLAYARVLGKTWKTLCEDSLEKITEWSRIHVALHIGSADTVFYPFGGPDAAYPLRFFPKMRNYILVGLEPIGNFEHIEKNIENKSTLVALQQAFFHYMKKGYFITSQMMTQLSNQNIRGALCLILIELARSGYSIHLIEDKSLDTRGNEIDREKGTIDCVKIVFQSIYGGAPQNLYYVRTDLTNSNGRLSSLMNFVRRFQFVTFIKSASYVLHDQISFRIRSFILENSDFILQDDTGIRFSHFNSRWKKYAFGKYTKPTLPIFHGYEQNDLRKFFEQSDPGNIPFKIGYGFAKNRPNLILAVSNREASPRMQAKNESEVEENPEELKGGCPCKKKKKAKTA